MDPVTWTMKVDERTGKPTVTGQVARSSFIIKSASGEQIQLPSSIAKRSEAIKFLVNQKGFTLEQAEIEVEKLL